MQPVIELPQEPFLRKLFEHWQHSPTATIIRDRRDHDKDFTIEQFLFDIWTVQRGLYESLSEEVKDQLSDPDAEVFVAIVAPGGYRYCVLLLAVYYLGATAMPLSPNILPEEAKYFLDTGNAQVLLTVPSTATLGDTISKAYSISNFTFDVTRRPLEPPEFVLAEKTSINPEKAYIVIYTSGTTGFPKGVVHSRRSAITALQAHAEPFRLTHDDLWLVYETMHYVREAATRRRGDATCTFISPSRLYQLKDALDTIRMEEPLGLRYKATIAGIRRLRVLLTGSDQVSPWIRDIWNDIRGRPLLVLYTSTEMLGPVASTGFADVNVPSDSVGRIHPQVEVKIADSGEICVRKPGMFTRYIGGKPGETEAAFDAEGYYKMGDTGRLENDILYVLGRASQDVIRAGTWKIYTPGIEEAISSHPLISQAIVLGIPDPIYGQQVAVLVVPRSQALCQDRKSIPGLSLLNLRHWLNTEKAMPPLRQPSMLRIVKSRYDVPTTESMKPIKAKIRELFFSKEQLANGEVEVCEPIFGEPGAPTRPFNHEGLQS